MRKLRKDGPLEAIEWPTGEEVVVVRPNTYTARFWYREVVPQMGSGDAEMLELLVKYAAMVCPGKTEEQIATECDEEFLVLLAGYANNRLKQAEEILALLSGKAEAETPAPVPPSLSGISPAESPAPLAVPCGT